MPLPWRGTRLMGPLMAAPESLGRTPSVLLTRAVRCSVETGSLRLLPEVARGVGEGSAAAQINERILGFMTQRLAMSGRGIPTDA